MHVPQGRLRCIAFLCFDAAVAVFIFSDAFDFQEHEASIVEDAMTGDGGLFEFGGLERFDGVDV